MKTKKKLRKLIFSLALVLGLALGTAAGCSFAEEATVDGVTYTYEIVDFYYNHKVARITNVRNDENVTSCTVPTQLGGKSVVIGTNAFSNCTLQNVKIDNIIDKDGNGQIVKGIERIEKEAFANCASLQNVEIGERNDVSTNNHSLDYIDDNIFLNCTNLKTAKVPGSRHGDIVGSAPSHFVEVKDNLFIGCTGLESVVFTGECTSIYLPGCTSLKRINSPNQDGCGALHENVQKINLSGCSSLESMVIPQNFTEISEDMFSGCTNLKRVNSDEDGKFVLPIGTIAIKKEAFKNCKQLKNIIIPDSVTQVGKGVFSGCDNLVCNTYENMRYLGSTTNNYYLLVEPEDKNIKFLKIHKDTKIIPDCAFENFEKLQNVTIPGDGTSVGNKAFFDCNELKTVTIGKNQDFWRKEAFSLNNREELNFDLLIPCDFTLEDDGANYDRHLRVDNDNNIFTIYYGYSMLEFPKVTGNIIYVHNTSDSQPNYQYVDARTHRFNCTRSGCKTNGNGTEKHTCTIWTQENEKHTGTCTVCGGGVEEEHSFDNSWKQDPNDSTKHIGVCKCGKEQSDNHKWNHFEWIGIDEHTEKRECICGMVQKRG